MKHNSFCVCVRTDIMVEKGMEYGYVAARGTKKEMQRWFDCLTAIPETISCKIARYNNAGASVGATIQEYRR